MELRQSTAAPHLPFSSPFLAKLPDYFWSKQTGGLGQALGLLKKADHESATTTQQAPFLLSARISPLPAQCRVHLDSQTSPSLWRQPGCLSMNWHWDGVAACRPAGSLPLGGRTSPLWHARHPLARGPWPAISSQCSDWVCHPADSAVTLLHDTDLVPWVAGKVLQKPFDPFERDFHSTYYKLATWVNSPSHIFACVVTHDLSVIMPTIVTIWSHHAGSGSE